MVELVKIPIRKTEPIYPMFETRNSSSVQYYLLENALGLTGVKSVAAEVTDFPTACVPELTEGLRNKKYFRKMYEIYAYIIKH